MRVAVAIELTDQERATLDGYARGRSTPARLVLRAKIVLQAAKGRQNKEIAEDLGTLQKTVGLWRNRFAKLRIAGIEKDAPGRGRPKTIGAKKVADIVRITTQETPPNATQWSTRDMAKASEVSASTVRRIWREHGLKPHVVRGFKVSRDPEFAEKRGDVVGLYLNPPANAIVLSCDKKSQIQALDRTQPSLPFCSGRTKTVTHDYKRNGTSTLFAAMNTLNGKVLSMCAPRHRHQEWLRFLQMIDRETAAHLEIHVIADNYATQKHDRVARWLARHPRFHMHFTPTSASWLNMVERFFRDITTKRIRRGVFPSVEALVQAIENYIAEHNLDPKPFIWTAKAGDILAKVTRARAALANDAPSV
jgi:transposase